MDWSDTVCPNPLYLSSLYTLLSIIYESNLTSVCFPGKEKTPLELAWFGVCVEWSKYRVVECKMERGKKDLKGNWSRSRWVWTLPIECSRRGRGQEEPRETTGVAVALSVEWKGKRRTSASQPQHLVDPPPNTPDWHAEESQLYTLTQSNPFIHKSQVRNPLLILYLLVHPKQPSHLPHLSPLTPHIHFKSHTLVGFSFGFWLKSCVLDPY